MWRRSTGCSWQGLFAASPGPGGVGAGEHAVPAPPPRSGLNVGVAGAGEDYRRSWAGVVGLDAQTNGAAGDGKSENERGRAGAAGVRELPRSGRGDRAGYRFAGGCQVDGVGDG